MVDPEAYEGPIPVEPEVVVDHDGPADWDEDELAQGSGRPRRKRLLPTSSPGRRWTKTRLRAGRSADAAAEAAMRPQAGRSRWC